MQQRPPLELKKQIADRSALYKAFDNLSTAVAVVDAQGAVVFANVSLEDLLGLSRRNIQGAEFAAWCTEPDLVRHVLHHTQKHHWSMSRLLLRLCRPGTQPVPVQACVTQISDAPENFLIELHGQQQLARQEREERLIDQTENSKELVRNLAHEIKNPLGGIRGAAQLLEMEMDVDSGLTEYTQVIIHEADRLQTLVDRLLEPHRHSQVLVELNIHEVFERVRTLVQAEFAQGLKIVCDYDASIPEFRADRGQLIQAVLNVVHNAAQALVERIAQGDAIITLRTRVARQVTFGKQRHKLALELHVIDNGPGIPDAIKERIFFPLVSGREGGAGLGLTLAQTYVQQHHGLIECDSAPGCTDFKILIPLP